LLDVTRELLVDYSDDLSMTDNLRPVLNGEPQAYKESSPLKLWRQEPQQSSGLLAWKSAAAIWVLMHCHCERAGKTEIASKDS